MAFKYIVKVILILELLVNYQINRLNRKWDKQQLIIVGGKEGISTDITENLKS